MCVYIYIYKRLKKQPTYEPTDVGSETSVSDSVQTNTMINKRLKCRTTTSKTLLKYNKNN